MKKLVLLFIVSSLFFTSCSSTGFLMAKPKVLMYGQAYSAKEADAQIDIYTFVVPNKEYVEIAQITCEDSNDEWNLKQILIKAREIGANGIIIVGKEYGIKAVAIKYKENILASAKETLSMQS